MYCGQAVRLYSVVDIVVMSGEVICCSVVLHFSWDLGV